MRYVTALATFCIGLMAGWILGERSASPPNGNAIESRRVPYHFAEPAAGRLRLDSLVLKRNPGFTPQPQYDIAISDAGVVTYRGYSNAGAPLPASQVLGRAGKYSTRIDRDEFSRLASLAIWPEHSSGSTPIVGFDSRHAELTLFFSKVLVGEGDPEFASLIEELLSGASWEAASTEP